MRETFSQENSPEFRISVLSSTNQYWTDPKDGEVKDHARCRLMFSSCNLRTLSPSHHCGLNSILCRLKQMDLLNLDTSLDTSQHPKMDWNSTFLLFNLWTNRWHCRTLVAPINKSVLLFLHLSLRNLTKIKTQSLVTSKSTDNTLVFVFFLLLVVDWYGVL